MNCIGTVNAKDIIAVHGMMIFDRGKIPGKKSYNINKIIGTLSTADILNFLHRYVVSFCLFSVSSTF